MDIVSALSSQLKLDPETAGGLVGNLLELMEERVLRVHGAEAASSIGQKIPEMRSWKRSAPTLPPKAMSITTERALNAGPAAGFVSILVRHGLEAEALAAVAPILRQFLATRLDPTTLAQVTDTSGFL